MMPSRHVPFALALAFLNVAGASPAWAADAREIMQRSNDRNDGEDERAGMKMILIDGRGNQRIRNLRFLQKDVGRDTYTLALFLTPADVKNTGFLSYDYDAPGRDDDQWLYVPAMRKTKRITTADRSGSFLGSDFNYSDIGRLDLADFDFRVMQEVEVEGAKTWQIEALPKSDDVAAETGYSRSVYWVRQDNLVPIRAMRWVNGGQRVKLMQVTKLRKIGDAWVVAEVQMTTREGRTAVHSTVLRWHDIELDLGLDDGLFTVRQLEQGL